jgi:hypothetical protein
MPWLHSLRAGDDAGLCTVGASHFLSTSPLLQQWRWAVRRRTTHSISSFRSMHSAIFDEKTSECCTVCNCLGYCTSRSHDQRSSLVKRSFADFRISAKEKGCLYCDVALQSFMLLRFLNTTMQVELVTYPESPTELHSLANRGAYDVVEIYPSSGKLGCLVEIFYNSSCN